MLVEIFSGSPEIALWFEVTRRGVGVVCGNMGAF